MADSSANKKRKRDDEDGSEAIGNDLEVASSPWRAPLAYLKAWLSPSREHSPAPADSVPTTSTASPVAVEEPAALASPAPKRVKVAKKNHHGDGSEPKSPDFITSSPKTAKNGSTPRRRDQQPASSSTPAVARSSPARRSLNVSFQAVSQLTNEDGTTETVRTRGVAVATATTAATTNEALNSSAGSDVSSQSPPSSQATTPARHGRNHLNASTSDSEEPTPTTATLMDTLFSPVLRVILGDRGKKKSGGVGRENPTAGTAASTSSTGPGPGYHTHTHTHARIDLHSNETLDFGGRPGDENTAPADDAVPQPPTTSSEHDSEPTHRDSVVGHLEVTFDEDEMIDDDPEMMALDRPDRRALAVQHHQHQQHVLNSVAQQQAQQQQQQQGDSSLDSTGDDSESGDDGEFDSFMFIATLPPRHVMPVILPAHPVLPPSHDCDKITLVLDLDETLVHCSLEPPTNYDLVFKVPFSGDDFEVFVKKRPNFEAFLDRVSSQFEVVVFTASQQVYADRLLDILDPQRKWIHHRLFRDSCVQIMGNFLKDLSVLGRDLSKVVIVDNSPHVFAYQLDNGIPIESWYDDDADQELPKLLPFLELLTHAQDVRPLLQERFKLQERVNASRKLFEDAANSAINMQM